MFPDPWRTNPVGRFWDRLRGRDVTPRYLAHLTKKTGEQLKFRRYILLILTLAQTVVATRYMKSSLSGTGASVSYGFMVDPVCGFPLCSFCLYVLQAGILILFCGTVLGCPPDSGRR